MSDGRKRADETRRRGERPTILFVSPVADVKGGAERVLLHAMANPAIRPALALPGVGELTGIARERGIPVHRFDLGAVSAVRREPSPLALLSAARAALKCAAQIAAAARAEGADAVQTNGLKVHVAGAMARVLSGGGIRCIPHLHDIPYTRLERAIWRGVAAASTRTLIVSPPCMPGRRSAKVAVVMNATDRPLAERPRQGLSAEPTLGFVGRFHPFKGVDRLLDWFEAAAPEHPGLRLLLRGRASEESGTYWDSLQPRIAALGTRCRVEDWSGPGVDPYEGMDLLVVPSVTPDPSPLVIMEAMASAIPVIGAPVGGIPILIADDGAGRTAGSRTEFAAALRSLLRPEAYRLASAAALDRARRSLSLEGFWSRLNDQYRQAGLFGTEGVSPPVAARPGVPA